MGVLKTKKSDIDSSALYAVYDIRFLGILNVVQQLHIEVVPPHLFQVEECGIATGCQPVIQVVRSR